MVFCVITQGGDVWPCLPGLFRSSWLPFPHLIKPGSDKGMPSRLLTRWASSGWELPLNSLIDPKLLEGMLAAGPKRRLRVWDAAGLSDDDERETEPGGSQGAAAIAYICKSSLPARLLHGTTVVSSEGEHTRRARQASHVRPQTHTPPDGSVRADNGRCRPKLAPRPAQPFVTSPQRAGIRAVVT